MIWLTKDLSEGSACPAKRVCEFIPLGDELVDGELEFVEVGEIGVAESLALENREPLLNLICPRAVDGREMEPEARMLGEPSPHELAMVRADVVANHVDNADGGRGTPVDLFEEFDELDLALAAAADADHFTATGIEGGQEIKGPGSGVLVLKVHRDALGLSGARRGGPWSRLQGGLFVRGEHPFVGFEGTGVEVAEIVDPLVKLVITGPLRTQPVVDSPGLETLRTEQTLDRLRRDRVDHIIAYQRAGQLGACPQRQRSPCVLWQLAGELDQMGEHYRGKK